MLLVLWRFPFPNTYSVGAKGSNIHHLLMVITDWHLRYHKINSSYDGSFPLDRIHYSESVPFFVQTCGSHFSDKWWHCKLMIILKVFFSPTDNSKLASDSPVKEALKVHYVVVQALLSWAAELPSSSSKPRQQIFLCIPNKFQLKRCLVNLCFLKYSFIFFILFLFNPILRIRTLIRNHRYWSEIILVDRHTHRL